MHTCCRAPVPPRPPFSFVSVSLAIPSLSLLPRARSHRAAPRLAPSRRRANDLIREQWLSINNPVSPFTLPGHPPRRGASVVRCLSADCLWPSPPQPRTRTLSPTSARLKIAVATTVEILAPKILPPSSSSCSRNLASCLARSWWTWINTRGPVRLHVVRHVGDYARSREVLRAKLPVRKREDDVHVCLPTWKSVIVCLLLKLGKGRDRSKYLLFYFFFFE